MVSIEVEELSAHCPVYNELTFKITVVVGLNLDNNNLQYLLIRLANNMQESSLEDYIQLSVMMQYNYHNDK